MCACIGCIMFPVVCARPEQAVCLLLKAESGRGRCTFEVLAPLCSDMNACNSQKGNLERYLNPSVVTQEKLVGSPAASNTCEMDHEECTFPPVRYVFPWMPPGHCHIALAIKTTPTCTFNLFSQLCLFFTTSV